MRVQGLKSKPELNGKIAVVTGPPAETGRIPCTIAPVLPTEELARISAKEDNLELLPHPPDIMATAWNNVALALKRSDALVEANGAFMTAHKYAPSGSPIQLNTLGNWIKLCAAMRLAGVADESALESKVSSLMGQLFGRVTSRPELRGLDAVYAIDFVPGYSQRQLMCGIANSVDAQPARQHGQRRWLAQGCPRGLRGEPLPRGCRREAEFCPKSPKSLPLTLQARSKWARLFVFDQASSKLVEVNARTGAHLSMSGAAQQAIQGNGSGF